MSELEKALDRLESFVKSVIDEGYGNKTHLEAFKIIKGAVNGGK